MDESKGKNYSPVFLRFGLQNDHHRGKSSLESRTVKTAQTSSCDSAEHFPLHITSISLSQALLLTPDLTSEARLAFTEIRCDLYRVRICYAPSLECSNDVTPI
jgi:hypothetical protein